MYLTTNPKAIPHKPCSSVKQTTHTIGPSAKKILRKICNNKCKTFYKLLSNHEKKLVHGPIIQVNLTEKNANYGNGNENNTWHTKNVYHKHQNQCHLNNHDSALGHNVCEHDFSGCDSCNPTTFQKTFFSLQDERQGCENIYIYIFLVKKVKSNTIPRLK